MTNGIETVFLQKLLASFCCVLGKKKNGNFFATLEYGHITVKKY